MALTARSDGVLRAATRGSALALWQTNYVAKLLTTAIVRRETSPIVGTALTGGSAASVNPASPAGPAVPQVEPLVVATTGDQQTNLPIADIGGKGVFVKEVQAAVLDGRADFAVHSAKDLPSATPEGLVIAAVPPRADPRDVLVGCGLAELRPEAVVATGSARRKVQLKAIRPDLKFVELRGNIGTRLAKAKDCDAVVMAKAALDRLGETPSVLEVLSSEVMVPQVGQGALAVECRADDEPLQKLLACIEEPYHRIEVDAERAFLATLGGDCSLPAGAYAELTATSSNQKGLEQDLELEMQAILGDANGGACYKVTGRIKAEEWWAMGELVLFGMKAEGLGRGLAEKLLQVVPQ